MSITLNELASKLHGDTQPNHVDFGDRRSSKLPFISRFSRLGVPIHANTVTSIRLGNAS
ncbi:MAG: hypothetical protein Q7R95_08380 [bacterium]|nr:hypothetical protein [bacterium]